MSAAKERLDAALRGLSGEEEAPSPPPPDAVGEIRAARVELAAAVSRANLTDDPLRHVMSGLSSALGAFASGIETVRRPLDPASADAFAARAAEAAAGGARREVGRLALAVNRRLAFLAGGGLALLVGAAGLGGYVAGRAEEARHAGAAAGALAEALRNGSESARAWLGLIRENDVLGALRRCEGRATWTDAAGRRACAVPLWLDAAAPVTPQPEGSRTGR